MEAIRLVSESELFARLTVLRDERRDSDDPVDHAIAVGLDRAITELVLLPTEGWKK